MAYAVLRDAIVNRKQVTCMYRGFAREICPHVIGGGKDGNAMVLPFNSAVSRRRDCRPAASGAA